MEDGDDMDVSIDGATSKRACDACRTRKIRCDRTFPCSNCRASKLTCTTTAPTQKAQRQRVHISEEYEKKIDRIEDRLAGIEHVLESLALKLGDLDIRRDSSEYDSQPRSSRKSFVKSPGTVDEASTPAPFEGETAIHIQSDYARELLAKAVGSTPSIGQNEEVRSALLALDNLVSRHGQSFTSTLPGQQALINRSLADIDPEKLEKPPWEAVQVVINNCHNCPGTSLAIVFPFLKLKNIKTILEDAYHNPGQCGATRRMLAYGVMHSIFEEFTTFPPEGMNPNEYRTYVAQCKIQMEVAMSQLDIFIPASYENIMALLLGGACAIDMCRPTLCSVMIGTAAGLCQNLGYHRYQTMKDDSEDERNSKIHIFWMIYVFDKTMSLRLGRASFIQDWDISLPFFADNVLPEEGTEGKDMLVYWIKVARIQGETYERLFSPAAFLRSTEERTQTASDLVNSLNQAWYERCANSQPSQKSGIPTQKQTTVNPSPIETEVPSRRKRSVKSTLSLSKEARIASNDQVEDIFFYVDVVMHYSTCALIQRAVSPDNVTFNEECLESARAALVAHMRCNARFNRKGNEEFWTGYIHWSILQVSVNSFIVIFCNTIQNTDPADMKSLQEFVTSLEPSRTISEGADNLYKMCYLFLQVAKLYLQAKIQDNRIQPQTFSQNHSDCFIATDGIQLDPNAMTQFDPYLSALGLMPNSTWPVTNYTNAQPLDSRGTYSQTLHGGGSITGLDMSGIGQNSVQDWYSGSRYLMNLMEAGDDSHMPDLNH
ncbi:fungal-specific transcription factor domain-containing protein [Phaeosphaeriaceae sp. PMI808]|nr:fungal-specific transcription factor domain-containing protein [Phaeosphaeriaceae sp. PMI808]